MEQKTKDYIAGALLTLAMIVIYIVSALFT